MPRKIRELEADRFAAGFIVRRNRGKGDHRQFLHPNVAGVFVYLDGRAGADAKHYQERQVAAAVDRVRRSLSEDRKS